jgi:hypothetical protein
MKPQVFSDDSSAEPNWPDREAGEPEQADIAVLPTGLLGNLTSVRTLHEELIAKHERAAGERSEDAARMADEGLHLLGELRALHTHREALLGLAAYNAAQADRLIVLNHEIAVKRKDYQGVRMFCDMLNREAGQHLQAAQHLRRQGLM